MRGRLRARMGDERRTSQRGAALLEGLAHKAGGVRILADAGIVRPVRPDKLARMLVTLVRWGRGPAAGYITGECVAIDGGFLRYGF